MQDCCMMAGECGAGGEPLVIRRRGERAQRDASGDVVVADDRGEPAVPVGGDRLVLDVCVAAALPVHAVDERVDQEIAARQAEPASRPWVRWPATPTRIRRVTVSATAGSCPRTSSFAVPSRRPRWKIGPHSTRNAAGG